MIESGRAQQRINIQYFDGVNGQVSFNLAKKTEFVHAENARSTIVGVIEKRGGQKTLGVNTNNLPFVTKNNYGIFSFENDNEKNFYRISVNEDPTININVSDDIFIGESLTEDKLTIAVVDSVIIGEKVNDHTNDLATVYKLNNSNNQWTPLTGSGANIPGGDFDTAYAEGCLFMVNGNSNNRYIDTNGETVIESTLGSGHLFNTPISKRVNFYKNRLYLADFKRDGVRYETTILRSSYPMGLIALLNNDYTNVSGGGTFEITDTKYIYSDAGANTYDIYRGSLFIATITVTSVTETSITATWSGSITVQSSDELWISGTYNGKKVFRWAKNPTISGSTVKQYDTFKLSGGENDAITMMTNIGNVMMVANKSSIMTWNDYTLENFDLDIGCASHKGYTKLAGTLYFLHYNGIYATSGGIPKKISNKIERYITGATKTGKENAAAGKKGVSVFFSIGDVTLYKDDGSIDKLLKDVCLEYNNMQENWYVHTNVKASEFATFVEETDTDRLELSDNSGNHSIKEFLVGETDDGSVIPFRVDFMKLTPGIHSTSSSSASTAFEYSCKPLAVMAEVLRGSSIQAYINLENGEEYFPIEGNLVKGLSIVKIKDKDENRGEPPNARLVSISLRDTSKQICRISRLAFVYIPTTDENVNNEI